jgi:hypothetical protein
MTQKTLGVVSLHSISYRTPGCHPKPCDLGLVGKGNQHNQRVGVRLSIPPHPLEIGGSGKTEPAVHPSAPHSYS